MDGSPSRGMFRQEHLNFYLVSFTDTALGETIPIRLFLGGFDLTPTFRDVNKKYSTRYYLSLVLIDEGTHFAPCVAILFHHTATRVAPQMYYSDHG